MSKVTQEQIARATGVSQTAVSAILGGRSRIQLSDETRRRVLDTAQRLGYHRAPTRQPAPAPRSRHIGLVVTEALQTAFTDEYYSAIYSGLEETLWENHYHFVLPSPRDQLHQPGAVPRFLQHGHVAGLVVLSAAMNVPSLVDTGLPVIAVGHFVSHPGVDSVYPDNIRAGSLAAEHLLELGHREFVVLTGPPYNRNFAERLDVFEQTIRRVGGAVAQVLHCEARGGAPETERKAYAEVAALLAKPKRGFTAVFAVNDYMARGALAALREAHVAVPGQVSVVGFLDVPSAAQQDPPLTTIRVPAHQMGRVAARRLMERLEHPDEPTGLKILIPVELVVRGSTGPPLASPGPAAVEQDDQRH